MKRAVAVLALLSAPVLATAIRPFAGMRGDANLGGNTPNGSPTSAAPSPTFDLIAGATTPNDLPDTLTVNSTAMTLLLACDAQGISGTNWTCRDANGATTLVETGTGASPTTTTLVPFRAFDSAELGATYTSGAKTHSASSSSSFNIATQDFAIEYVGRMPTANAAIIDKGVSGTDGYRLSGGGGTSLTLTIRTASASSNVQAPGASGVSSSFMHSISFVDRDEATANGASLYLNGNPGSGVSMSARSASLSNSTVFAVGGLSGNAGAGSGASSSLRIWVCPPATPQCFAGGATNPTQWAAIARERASVAWGIAPSAFSGNKTPTLISRTGTAYVDVVSGVTRNIYLTASHAPRVVRRTHSGGTAVAGYLSEPSVSNLALQSQTLGTTWTAITAGDNVLADAFAGADQTVTGDDIDGNNSNAEHGLRQGITLTAAAHTFSAWAKTGTQNFVALRNATIANGVAWFDVATCTSSSCIVGEDCASAVGTTQAGISRASAERYPIDTTGDGVADVNLCRVSITYTGTAVSHNHDLLCAPSNGNLAYTDSDASADCGFWGVRVEAFPTATSYLATTTVASVRNADDVRFDGASHYTGSPSTMDAAFLCPSSIAIPTANPLVIFNTQSGASTFASLGVGTGGNAVIFEGFNSTQQWSINSSNPRDGVAHSIRQTMQTNGITAYFDGLSVGTDTAATLFSPSSNTLTFAVRGGVSTQQSSCLVSRARIWSSIVTPAVAP